jgi:hypothetical protein
MGTLNLVHFIEIIFRLELSIILNHILLHTINRVRWNWANLIPNFLMVPLTQQYFQVRFKSTSNPYFQHYSYLPSSCYLSSSLTSFQLFIQFLLSFYQLLPYFLHFFVFYSLLLVPSGLFLIFNKSLFFTTPKLYFKILWFLPSICWDLWVPRVFFGCNFSS